MVMRGSVTSRHLSGALDAFSVTFQQPWICDTCQFKRVGTVAHVEQKRPQTTARRRQSSWVQAASIAKDVINGGVVTDRRLAGIAVDPLRQMGKEMKFLAKNMRQLLGSGHPMLDTVSKYYTASEGKHMRPLIVLLMSQATADAPKLERQLLADESFSSANIDDPISPAAVLADENPESMSAKERQVSSISSGYNDEILPSQRRLAEITELIHTASLLHDDVIDESTSRRSAPSANIAFGNKMAVLAGDFLLGRASVALARLRNPEVVELLATVIANLIEGEFMQLRNTALNDTNPIWSEEALTYYLQKTYLKTASLISKSCRASALLGHNAPEIVDAAYTYGRNLGLAFQLIDDMLDYTTSSADLGKPAGADLELGLATAPLLFAWKSNPDLGVLVGRKFAGPGDVQMARDMVQRSDGLQQTKALAQGYADKAIKAIRPFPDSEAKDGLVEMCMKTMTRKK